MKQIKFFNVNNNEGSTIVVVLLMLMALSLAVIMAMDTSMMNSSMMRNNRDYRDHLYRAESGISIAAEVSQATWLAGTSILFDLTDGDADRSDQLAVLNDVDNNSVNISEYDIARIEDYENDINVDNLLDSDALTRDFYALSHIAPPPVGSGHSPKNFEIRRYGIHSQAFDRQAVLTPLTLEAGLFKFFNKFI